jgi:hypothetical protein
MLGSSCVKGRLKYSHPHCSPVSLLTCVIAEASKNVSERRRIDLQRTEWLAEWTRVTGWPALDHFCILQWSPSSLGFLLSLGGILIVWEVAFSLCIALVVVVANGHRLNFPTRTRKDDE